MFVIPAPEASSHWGGSLASPIATHWPQIFCSLISKYLNTPKFICFYLIKAWIKKDTLLQSPNNNKSLEGCKWGIQQVLFNTLTLRLSIRLLLFWIEQPSFRLLVGRNLVLVHTHIPRIVFTGTDFGLGGGWVGITLSQICCLIGDSLTPHVFYPWACSEGCISFKISPIWKYKFHFGSPLFFIFKWLENWKPIEP